MQSDDAPPPAFSGRALLIEDNAIVALDAEEMLKSLGFEAIDIAPTTARALALIAQHAYAAALVDLMLRDGASAPAIDALAARGVPIVIASGSVPDPRQAASANAPRITKPYDEFALRAALAQAWRSGRPPPAG
jgi:CheY-like chemotaxis protein